VVSVLRQPDELTADTDEVTYPMGFEERVVLGMARRALSKEETINPGIEAEIQRIEQHIDEVAWNRLYAGAQIRNVDRVERGWHTTMHIPTRDYWVFL
jgi:hypothetical protein